MPCWDTGKWNKLRFKGCGKTLNPCRDWVGCPGLGWKTESLNIFWMQKNQKNLLRNRINEWMFCFLKSLTKEACFLLDSLLIEVIKNNFSVISLTFYVNCKAAVSIIVFWTISGLGAQLTNLGLPCFSQGQQLYPCNSFF